MAGRRFASRSHSVKRHPDWAAHTPQTTFTAVAGSSAVLLQSLTPDGGGETVIRTRGLVGWKSDQTVANEDQMGAFGICLVSAQAVSVGITAVPHPDMDVSYPWLWHSFFASSFVLATAVGFEPNAFHSIVVDSKAMRKVTDDHRLAVVVENSNSDGIVVYDAFRFLTKQF